MPEEKTWDFEKVGHAVMADTIAAGKTPRTVLCANDRIAFGALLAACEAGLRVGHVWRDRDIRIAGHDDHPRALHLPAADRGFFRSKVN